MSLSDVEVLRRTFVVETGEQLDEMEQALIELESHGGDGTQLQRIFRLAHTFKGNAGSLGFRVLAALGHAIEDVLAHLERGGAPASQPVCDILLESADAIRQLLPDALAGLDHEPPAAKQALEKLEQLAMEMSSVPVVAARILQSHHDLGSVVDARLKTVRVDVAKLDRMVDLVGEIAVCRSRVRQQMHSIGTAAGKAVIDELDQIERFHAELEDVVLAARMVPIGSWLRQYARAVRDVAQAHGKQARLAVEGGDVEADLAMLDRLRDPLTHVIRNAVDHGIEAPDQRLQRGKDPTGTVTFRARREGGGITLQIIDDGVGLLRDRIIAGARTRGMRDPDALSSQELAEMLFEPGFSTATELSDLSGRGLGLSVVRQRIEALRGSIHVESTEGLGTCFTIQLPLTLATIEGLVVWACGERFVIPLDAVMECVDGPGAALVAGRRSLLELRGTALPCVRLRGLFDTDDPGCMPLPAREAVVVVMHEGQRAGLVVDAIDGAGRTIIKPLGQLFRGIACIAGSTILGDGRVALILDVPALFKHAISRERTATAVT